MNYIVWNGQDSRYIKGLVISELPPITKPQMRVTETVIDGVDGSVIEEVGYSPYDRPLLVGITPQANIDEVIKFFSGKGDVVFSNEPDKYYKAHIVNQIDYTRLVRFRTATVTFRVQPFKYEYLEEVSNLNLDKLRNMANIKTITGYEYSVLLPKTASANFVVSKLAGNNFSYSVSGDGYLIGLTNNITLKANTTYTLSMERNETGGSSYRNFVYENSNGEYSLLANHIGTNKVTITFTTGDTGSIALGLGVGNNSSGASGTISNIMIVEGEVAHPFIEYGWYELVAVNEGNYISKPIIKITGSGTFEFTLNGDTIFSYTFPENDDSVVIDSQKQDAYWGSNLKNRNMVGEFPVFEVGENTIGLSGEVSNIEASARSRWL